MEATPWRVGTARVDITPDRPVPLAGFATRAASGPATETASPLSVRALALRPDGERRPTVVVVADVLCWGDDTAEAVRRRCAAELGVDADHLVLHATHTHSAPQPSGGFAVGLGVPDADWIAALVDRTVQAVARAVAGEEPATLETATGHLELGVDRRHARTGGAWPATPPDHRLRTFALRRPDGSPVAVAFHHACHPTIHHANRVSAEFPGAAMTALEAGGHAGTALYLQGSCGDVNPDRYRGVDYVAGDQDEVDATGHRLAAAVVELLAGPGRPVAPDPRHRRLRIELPTTPAPAPAELERLRGHADPRVAGWADLLLTRPDRRRPWAGLTGHRVRLGEGVELLGFSAELTTRYGRLVDELAGGSVWPLGYTGGMLGYLVTDEQLAEGGYEADEAPSWFGMSGPLQPGAESLVRALLGDLLELPDR